MEAGIGLPPCFALTRYSAAYFSECVVLVCVNHLQLGGERPPIDADWPEELQQLLKDSWSGDVWMRPKISEASGSSVELCALLIVMVVVLLSLLFLLVAAVFSESRKPRYVDGYLFPRKCDHW